MGLCTLRRDGFVSLNAEEEGTALTRMVKVDGAALHLNVDATGGAAIVAPCDDRGAPLGGFEQADPIRGDSTDVEVHWHEGTLGSLAGKEIRLFITLRGAKLYSFWLAS